MRLFEYEAKKVFKSNGIPVPKQYGIIQTPEELKYSNLNFPVMLKANVLTGGRGKAGGVKKADNLEEAVKQAEKILKLKIKGYPVESLFIEEAIPESLALFYIAATIDPITYNNVVMISPSGGVDIEEIAKKSPDQIIKQELDNENTFPTDAIFSLSASLKKKVSHYIDKIIWSIAPRVYEIYQKYDCKLVEINPLILTKTDAIAADAKIVLDDNGLYRQRTLLDSLNIKVKRHDIAEPTPNEIRAIKANFPYIDLLPPNTKKEPDKFYVGLVPGGAGYGIFSIDEVRNAGKELKKCVVPVNFMDSGGGPSKEKVAEMFHLLMDYKFANKQHLDLILTSRFGGVSSCDVFIKGLVQCLRDRYKNKTHIVPVYGRMVGTDLPSAREFLEKAKNTTPKQLSKLEIIVGNQMIMAQVIKGGIKKCLKE